MRSLLAPVIEYVHAFAFGDDGDGAAVLVSAHAADNQVSGGFGGAQGSCMRTHAPEVHPQVLLRALAPVVLLHLRVEAHVVKPDRSRVRLFLEPP